MTSQKILGIACWLVFSVNVVSAGLSCLSNPCLHGICIDDLNSTYSCYCVDGYTGVLCQTNWDECWSSPCQNGGSCVDGIAAYNCSCPEGFVGDNCETNFDECESNPCQNNGTCVDMTNGYACACAPGFSGAHCEVDASVCDVGPERCSNGGVCIDGLGLKFYCRCPPGWSGLKCEDAIDECKSNPCQNGGVCIDIHADYLCACTFGFAGKNCETEIEFCNENSCSNNALCVVEDGFKVCYCVPDYHGEHCELQYDECLLGPGCMNGGTCIDGIDNFTCSCPPSLTGALCECLIINDTSTDCTYIAPSSAPKSEETSPITEAEISTDLIITQVNYILDNSTTTTTDHTTHGETPQRSSKEEDILDTTTTQIITELITFEHSTDADDDSTTVQSIIKFTTQGPTPDSTTFDSTTTCKSCHNTSDTAIEVFTFRSTISNQAEMTTDDIANKGTTEKLTTISGTTKVVSKSKEGDLNLEHTTELDLDESTEHMFTEYPPEYTDGTTTTTTTTDTRQTTTEAIDVHTTSETKATTVTQTECSESICNYHGSCYNTPQGIRCQCNIHYSGKFCDEEIKLSSAAFTGNSYIAHRILNTTAIKIKFNAKTLLQDGQIMFVDISKDVYMQLYMKSGLLKFKFSCGYQTMLLSELETVVNNGYLLEVESRLDIDIEKQNCNATLNLNDTVAMSGGQIANVTTLDPHMILYLGNMPNISATDRDPFYGCISNLFVNGLPRSVFGEAMDAAEIMECSSLACLSSPCMHGGLCKDNNDSYSCSCSNGWMGDHCQTSICEHNPCQSGGGCVPYPGSGFLCLCPYGKHGIFCEFNIDITRPSLAPLGAESSYMIYPLSSSSINSERFDLRLRFHTTQMDQIALLAFIGQNGKHDAHSQHLAITFVKGYLMLTWNLGSGSRRIFTPRPLSERRGGHTVRVARRGRSAWLSVDNRFNVSGNAPGLNPKMTTLPFVFIGGHRSSGFQDLPHDLPLHSGWNGCIWEIGGSAISSGKAIGGRGVGQCGVSQCSARSCNSPQGVCIHSPATYGCICNEGWYGVTCAAKSNPCDAAVTKCQGRCVISVGEPFCDCPYGRTGVYCEKELYPTDVLFTGLRSFVRLQPRLVSSVSLSFEAELKPTKSRGIILYVQTPHFYAALSIQGGLLEFRWTDALSGVTSLVRSGAVVSMSQWHRIKAGRYGSRLYVWLDGAMATDAMLAHAYPHTDTNTTILVGGAEDLSSLPFDAMSGPTEAFAGCIRNLHVNNVLISLEKQNIEAGRNLDDCDGTACGVEACGGGECVVEGGRARCTCGGGDAMAPGARCRRHARCHAAACRPPAGHCHAGSCICAAGYAGENCTQRINITIPQFTGNSLLVIGRNSPNGRFAEQMTHINTQLTEFALNFTTPKLDGLLFWTSMDNIDIGVGLANGILKIVSPKAKVLDDALRSPEPVLFMRLVQHTGFLADAEWHVLSVTLFSNFTVTVDGVVALEKHLEHEQNFKDLYIGGVPDELKTAKKHFPKNFEGCIDVKPKSEVPEGNILYSNVYSENIKSCQLFP